MKHPCSAELATPGIMKHTSSADMATPGIMKHRNSADVATPGIMKHQSSADVAVPGIMKHPRPSNVAIAEMMEHPVPNSPDVTSPGMMKRRCSSDVAIKIENDTKDPVPVPAKQFSNPAVVGLAAFGVTTFVLQLHSFGWSGVGPTVWLGLIFGGFAQLIAGLQEFHTGDTFGYSTFVTYGSFWIAFALLLIGDHNGIYKTTPNDRFAF